MSDRQLRFIIEDMLDKGMGAHQIAAELKCPLGKVQFVKRVYEPRLIDDRNHPRASGVVLAPSIGAPRQPAGSPAGESVGAKQRHEKAGRLRTAAVEFKRAHDSGLSPAEVAHLQQLRTRRGLSVAGLVKVTGHRAEAICAALGLDAAFARR